MKSIRTRLISSFVGTILIIYFSMAAVGLYYLTNAINQHSAESMQLLMREETERLDLYFADVERAVAGMEEYLMANVDIREFRSRNAYREELYKDLQTMAVNAARIVEDVEAVYFRPDPVLYGETAGFFLTASDNGTYRSVTPTDILKYQESDRGHVGWYYDPIRNGGPTWMEPYSNENINVYMISYVIPVYLGNEFLGVLGMDIDMTLVHGVIDQLDYHNSQAMLVSEDGDLLYNEDHPMGLQKDSFTGALEQAGKYFTRESADSDKINSFKWGRSRYRIIVGQLENNMLLAVVTPEAEILLMQRKMVFQLIMIFAAALVLVVLMSIRLTGRIVKPVQELTEVSSRIAKGELGQKIVYKSDDELGSLANSIRKISVELKDYIDYIHGQAYLDAMTGVRNKAAWMTEENRLDRLIRENMASFTVYVFDVNGLKKMNDTKGHEYGDMMIKDSALLIRTVFGGERVYRIGGDEFAAISEISSEDESRRQLARFDQQLQDFNQENNKYEEELAISRGFSIYQPDTDANFADVFGRADEDMYRCKAKYYETHGDRRRRS